MKNAVELHWAYFQKAQRGIFDQTLRNRLATAHDGLARREAHRKAQQCPVEYEELEQIARMGLIKAIDRFCPPSSVAFSSFAVPYIQGELAHFLRDHSWDLAKIPRRSIETASSVRRVRRKLIAQGRDIDEMQTARGMGISGDRWAWIAQATARKPVVSLESEERLQLVAEAEEIDEDRSRLHDRLQQQLGELPNPYQSCLLARFFGELSDEEIAKQQGVKPEQVKVWIEQGLERLKEDLEEWAV